MLIKNFKLEGSKLSLIFVLLPASVLIYIMEGPPLVKNKRWKELAALIALLGTSLLLVVEKAMKIVTPLEFVGGLLAPFGKALLRNFN